MYLFIALKIIPEVLFYFTEVKNKQKPPKGCLLCAAKANRQVLPLLEHLKKQLFKFYLSFKMRILFGYFHPNKKTSGAIQATIFYTS